MQLFNGDNLQAQITFGETISEERAFEILAGMTQESVDEFLKQVSMSLD